MYIAGPMSGLPNNNYDAFNEAAETMREFGWEVVNPAENHGGRQDLPREVYFRTDIPRLAQCDAILLLEGWENSEGARLEFAVARICGVRALSDAQHPNISLVEDDLLYEGAKVSLVSFTPYEYAPASHRRLPHWPFADEVRQPLTETVSTGGVDTWVTLPASNSSEWGEPDHFRAALADLAELHDKKKADYTGGEHPLANYRFSADAVGLPLELGMFARLSEKYFRLKQLLNAAGEPQNEPIEDTLRDIAIICILMMLARDPDSGYGA